MTAHIADGTLLVFDRDERMAQSVHMFTNCSINDIIDWCNEMGIDMNEITLSGGHLHYRKQLSEEEFAEYNRTHGRKSP